MHDRFLDLMCHWSKLPCFHQHRIDQSSKSILNIFAQGFFVPVLMIIKIKQSVDASFSLMSSLKAGEVSEAAGGTF